MTPDETRRLLGEIAVIDNRRMTPETARTWHDLLGGFDYTACHAAVKKIRLNTPDLWITPGHVAQVIRNEMRDAGRDANPTCGHRIPLGEPCHDCTHDPEWCQACMPIAGVSDTRDNMRATVAAFAKRWSRP